MIEYQGHEFLWIEVQNGLYPWSGLMSLPFSCKNVQVLFVHLAKCIALLYKAIAGVYAYTYGYLEMELEYWEEIDQTKVVLPFCSGWIV